MANRLALVASATVLLSLLLPASQAALSAPPRVLRPARKALGAALGAVEAADQDCGGSAASCADCATVLTCAKLNGAFKPISTTACPTSAPYCSGGACVSALSPDSPCYQQPTVDFTCVGDGYFPSPSNCKKYYFCSGGQPYEYDCSAYAGTNYGHAKAMCVPSSEAACATVACSAANVGRYQLWAQDSGVYFVCTDASAANAYVADCGADRQINATTGNCDLSCRREGRMADAADAGRYYECVRSGSAYVGPLAAACPGGAAFDADTERCVPKGGSSNDDNGDHPREEMFAPSDSVDESLYKIPEGLLIGSASAAYQVEGGWNASRKSPSVQDVFYHSRPNMENGDVACNSYELWREDIKMLQALQMQTYRFSISWPRVLPGGSQAAGADDVGVQYYHDLIDGLLAAGIQPIITLHHWDIPQLYQDDGGWLNSAIVDRFYDYADFAFKEYGDKVKLWVLMNEPHSYCMAAYEWTVTAPGVGQLGTGGYGCVHHMILAHAKAWHNYNDNYRATQQGRVGSSLNMEWSEPDGDSQAAKDAAERNREFMFAWIADPLLTGDYPKLMRDVVDANSRAEGLASSRLPSFSDDEKAMIKGAVDFLGLNHYSSMLYSPGSFQPSASGSMFKDVNVTARSRDSWVKTARGGVCPWGLRYVLNWIKDRYNNFPVLISESGYPGHRDEGVNDPGRTGYYSTYMRAAMMAVNKDGCNLIGYTAWSLADNLEWSQGYSMKFGLVYIDFNDPNRKRTLKGSASFFQEVARTRQIPYYAPVVEQSIY